MITPADIENKVFSKAVRGYKEEEVDDFLDLIILDMEKLMKENRQLKKELEKSQTQVDRHVSTESSVYETLEAAMITREAKESISRLTDEGNRLRSNVENLQAKYRQMLELELERTESMTAGWFEELERDFLPASISDLEQLTQNTQAEEVRTDAPLQATRVMEPVGKTEEKPDLTRTAIHIR